jgi:hypothetical protein
MGKSRRLVLSALIAVLAVEGGVVLNSSARANTEGGQRVLNSDGKAKRSNEPPSEMNDTDSHQSEMRAAIERYVADRGCLVRFYTVEASPTRHARLKQFYHDWLTTLAKLNFDSMSQDGRVDYLLFKNHLDHELRQLEIQSKALAEIAALVPFAQTITDLEDSRRRMEVVDSPKTAALLTRMARQIDETSKAVEAGLKPDERADALKTKKTVANRAVAAIVSLRNTLRNWFGFHNGYDPVFTWWTGEPYKIVDQSLEKYAAVEVRRSFGGAYGPLYQCAYLLGGLQLRALHRDLVDSGKMTNRSFHDAVLKENRIPIEMVRASLTNQNEYMRRNKEKFEELRIRARSSHPLLYKKLQDGQEVQS